MQIEGIDAERGDVVEVALCALLPHGPEWARVELQALDDGGFEYVLPLKIRDTLPRRHGEPALRGPVTHRTRVRWPVIERKVPTLALTNSGPVQLTLQYSPKKRRIRVLGFEGTVPWELRSLKSQATRDADGYLWVDSGADWKWLNPRDVVRDALAVAEEAGWPI